MANNPLSIYLTPPKGLSRIIILGLGPQVLTVEDFAHRYNVSLEIIAGPRQTDTRTFDGRVVLNELVSRGVNPIFVEDIRSLPDGPYAKADDTTIIFSFGSPYIIRQDLIDLYRGRVINSHGAPLPEWQGGGGFSWRIMANDRRGMVLYHLVTPGIDEGDIVYQQPYVFPEDVRLPQEWEAVAQTQEHKCLIDFLEGIYSGREFVRYVQNKGKATYFPRLHTLSQAYIDWSWSGNHVERFICAFSHPYDGAMTFLGDSMVHIYDGRFHPDKDFPHPFFKGIIFHVGKEVVRVAVLGGYLEVRIEDIRTSFNIRPGDRFNTPRSNLEQALSFRPKYTPTGLRGEGVHKVKK